MFERLVERMLARPKMSASMAFLCAHPGPCVEGTLLDGWDGSRIPSVLETRKRTLKIREQYQYVRWCSALDTRHRTVPTVVREIQRDEVL
jgi:hypothetical protein